MTFLNLLTNQVVIGRLSEVSGDKTAYQTVTIENVSIQRMSEEDALAIGGAIGKTFRLYADEDADIQKGDRLVDENGNEYKVIAVNKPAELGAFVHKEAVIMLVK